jgi:hypothetical protein
LGIISAPTFRLATPPVVEHPVDGFLDTALAELKQPGDVFYVTNKPKSHYYVFVLHKRTEPNAAVPVDLGEFDQLVMLPDLAKQLKVIDRANAATTDTGISLSQYVTQKRSDKFQKEWTAFLKDETKFNAEFAKGYDERVKSRRD